MPPLHNVMAQTAAEKAAGQWTIASRVSDALAVAEARFGLRDGSFNLLGYVFDGKFPRLGVDLALKTTLLILADYTEQDSSQAIYQLNAETGATWDYIRINQSTFDGNFCDTFAELIDISRGGLLAAL